MQHSEQVAAFNDSLKEGCLPAHHRATTCHCTEPPCRSTKGTSGMLTTAHSQQEITPLHSSLFVSHFVNKSPSGTKMSLSLVMMVLKTTLQYIHDISSIIIIIWPYCTMTFRRSELRQPSNKFNSQRIYCRSWSAITQQSAGKSL